MAACIFQGATGALPGILLPSPFPLLLVHHQHSTEVSLLQAAVLELLKVVLNEPPLRFYSAMCIPG